MSKKDDDLSNDITYLPIRAMTSLYFLAKYADTCNDIIMMLTCDVIIYFLGVSLSSSLLQEKPSLAFGGLKVY